MVETVKENNYGKFLTDSISNSAFKSNRAPIKTIIFDLGGVVFTDGTWMAIKKIKRSLRLNEEDCDSLEECFSNEPGAMGQLIRLGLMTLDKYLSQFAKKINLPKSKKKLIKHLWFSSYVPNYKMKKILKKLSKNYNIIAFSGNVKERIDYLKKRHSLLKFFDDMVFSYDYHKNKRNLEFYQELLNHLNCDPSEAILIDDSWNNIKRAEKIGINGIYFSYTEQFLRDLEDFDVKINI
jgi:HAD superfamily hydrolase (TIGR01509 family)